MHFISMTTANRGTFIVNIDRILFVRDMVTGIRLHFGGDDYLDIDGDITDFAQRLQQQSGQLPNERT